MNLFELFVKIGVDDQASGKLKDLSSKLGGGLKTAAKIGTAAVATAAAGIAALTTAAVNNYAEYEQLVGGVQTLFGLQGQSLEEYAATVGKTTDEALDEWLKYTTGERKILNNAEKAYKTAGLSANQYMSTVTGFSASLIQSLGGDTAKAADYADMAIVDMADNANKMGTSIDLIQNAYQGFAKQNYTMLDNLKLGYGGTKQEMQRLLDDAEKISGIKYDISSFADITQAIHVMQEEMGIAGATALEAGTTIEGSVNSMKAAWQNLLTGLADGNADIETLIDNLVTTIVGDGTESNLGVLGNIMPAVENALNGASTLVQKIVPQIIKYVPKLLNKNLPVLAKAAVSVLESIIESIDENKDELFKMIFELTEYVLESFVKMLPKITKLGLDIIVAIAKGLSGSLSKLLPTIVSVVLEIVDILTNKDTLSNLLYAATEIIEALADALLKDETLDQLLDASVTIIVTLAELIAKNVDKLFGVAVKIIIALVDYLLDVENLGKLFEAGTKIISALGNALVSAKGALSAATADVISFITKQFLGIDLSEAGRRAVKSFFDGFYSGLLGAPSLGGINSSIANSVKTRIDGSHSSGLDYVPFDGYIAQLHKGERVLTAAESRAYSSATYGDINITITGANYDDEEHLADAIARKIQEMTERRSAVYA